jgi:hypothetical protein
MSTTYIKPANVLQIKRPSHIRRNVFGLVGAVAGVAAVGAAVAIFLAPPAPRSLPAMDASLGYHDVVDTRPTISSVDASQSYVGYESTHHAVSQPAARPVVPAPPIAVVGTSPTSADFIVVEGPQGYAVSPRTAAPSATAPTGDSFIVIEGPQGYQVITRTAGSPAAATTNDSSIVETYADLPTIVPAAEYVNGVPVTTRTWADLPTLAPAVEYADGVAVMASVKTWADLPTVVAADEYRDGLALLAPSRTNRDLATVPGVSGYFDVPIA